MKWHEKAARKLARKKWVEFMKSHGVNYEYDSLMAGFAEDRFWRNELQTVRTVLHLASNELGGNTTIDQLLNDGL
jgi:hypothetical protein|tara:strand:+ start:7282 stop:7506 length:225 start_codon:yes stop_codon:yes gene_type:complete